MGPLFVAGAAAVVSVIAVFVGASIVIRAAVAVGAVLF